MDSANNKDQVKGDHKKQEVALVTNRAKKRVLAEDDDYFEEPDDNISTQQSDN